MLSLAIEPRREEYIAQEDITLSVEIENRGPDAVDIPDPDHPASPQPVYGVVGPSYPHGKLFTNLSIARERNCGDLDIPEPDTIGIEPGGVWRGWAPLRSALGQLLPGEYRVRSVLDWRGGTAQSAEKRFRVKAADLESVHVGRGSRPDGLGEGRVIFLDRNENSATLFAFTFHESRSDAGVAGPRPPIAQIAVGAGAAEVGAPFTNAPFFIELVHWTVWREGRDIKAISDASEVADSLTIPVEPLFLVRPPLKLIHAPVEALVVGADRQLYLCTFPVDFDPLRSGPQIAWSSPLPAMPVGITAALAPEGYNSRHLAFTVERDHGVEIFHSSYDGGGAIRTFQSVLIPHSRLVKTVPPALIVDARAHARVSALVSAEDGKSYSAVEAQFQDSAQPCGQPAVVSLGALPGAVTGGSVLYVENAGTPPRREIAVVAENHGLMRWIQSGRWKTMGSHVTPVIPLILVPGRNFSYVLCFDAERGFSFEPL